MNLKKIFIYAYNSVIMKIASLLTLILDFYTEKYIVQEKRGKKSLTLTDMVNYPT